MRGEADVIGAIRCRHGNAKKQTARHLRRALRSRFQVILGGKKDPYRFHYIVIFVVGAMIPYVSLMAGKMAEFA
jgi:aromatic ring-cleaving dioxygenase